MAGPLARLRASLAVAWKSAVAGARAGWSGAINWTQRGGIPVGWNWNYWQQGLRPLIGGESATLNACVNAYAMTLAQLPGCHRRILPSGGSEEVTTSALSRILRAPNDYQTRSDFMLNMVTQMLFTGNAYALAERNNRQEVTALHLMPSRACEPYFDFDSRALFYSLGDNPMAGAIDYLVPARDVLHIRARVHPHRPLWGISPIAWAAMARDANLAISATQSAFFMNASQPSGFLSTKERLTPEQMATLRAAWEERATGISSGSVPILGGGLEFQQMGISSQDSQLVAAFGMTVADIARAFAVPLPIIGDLSNATFNNVEQLISLWLSQGLGFYVEHIEIAFDKFFALPATEFVEFDTDSLLRTAFRDRIEGLTRAISGGLYSPDEARGKEGLAPAPGGYGDEPRLQAQVVPLSRVGEIPQLPLVPEVPPSAPGAPPGDGAPADGQAAKALADALQGLREAIEARDAERDARQAERDERLAAQMRPAALDTAQALAMMRDALARERGRQ